MTQGQTTRRPTRGVRNNNPGNIDRVKGTNWQGAAKEQTDSRFVTFISAEMGIRALVRTLLTYFKQHRLASVRGIINRWAPPVENNTAAYIDAVCRDIGRSLGRTINADERLDIDSIAVMRPLVVAIIAHENAGYAYPAGVIDEGLRLAGIADVKPRPLLKTGEIQGILAAAPLVAVSSAEVVDTLGKARDQLAPASGMHPAIQTLIVLLSLAGCIVVIWSRFARQRKTLS
ncbi:hypothetical protein [Brevundimonas sp. SPF441]|uniref:hypothetical protein n=1 Tax=Brevundimonas sp. SPF441 TaxID=2663795 RepID=UPI001E4D138A|nr:hypothetical protein [Brevundimonas sp. SPF441]